MKILIVFFAISVLTSCKPTEISPPNEIFMPPAENPDPPKSNTMKVTIGEILFTATITTNATMTAFKAMLPLTLSMNDFNSNEKVATLSSSLTTVATNHGKISVGDIMLYGSSSLVIFYETFSTSYLYTKIGRIDNTAGLKEALGKGKVTVKFEIDGN